MKAYKIIDFLKRKYPENLAEEWDNSGLIVGDKDSEVSKVFVSLDLTAGALEKAMSSGAQLVVTHHPFIFAGIKRITAHDYLGKRIIDAIRAGISVYSIHTNYDIARMADLNARDLELKNGRILAVTGENEEGEYGFGKIGEMEKPCDLDSFAEKVKKIYGLDHIRVYGAVDKKIETVAVCSGSGRSFIDTALKEGADVMITGDVDYHTAIDAVMKGIAVIDGGHYGTEYIFIEDVSGALKEQFNDLEVIKDDVEQPYRIL